MMRTLALAMTLCWPMLATAAEDARHDFDFHFGTWKTHVSRLAAPLTGSHEWLEYEGTTTVRPVWDGRANLVELEAEGPGGHHLELLSLRLYNPATGQWNLNVASSRGGTLGTPSVGGFKDRRGEFYADEEFGGRAVKVRFVIIDITPSSIHFEQSFSIDGGKTWEVNWIATDTRVP
jgi:hypothetical protein